MVAPVALVGLDTVDRQDLARVEGDDGDVLLVGDGQDPPAGERRTDLEVVQAAGPPQGEGALAVGDVVAEAEVARGAAPGWMGLGPRGIRRGRRAAPDRSVRPLLVVDRAEGVELGLQ